MTGYTVIKLNKEDYGEWNKFVDTSPQGDVFCYSWWLNSVTKSNFEIYTIIDKNKILAGIPLAYDKYHKINEPPFTRTLGILFKSQPKIGQHKRASLERKWINLLLENIDVKNFRQFCTHHNFTDWLPFRWKGLKQTTRYTYILNYEGKTAEDLRMNLNRGKKSIINRAEGSGITVEECEDFDLLYKYMQMTYKRQSKNLNMSFDDMKSLDQVIKKNGKRLILRAIDKANNIHALSYFVYNKRSAYYLVSGSDQAFKESGGQTLILWEAIKHFCGKVEYFNFGGSVIQRLEEHFRGFGGIQTPYFHIYNDLYLHENDIWYNINESLVHLANAFKAIKSKLL